MVFEASFRVCFWLLGVLASVFPTARTPRTRSDTENPLGHRELLAHARVTKNVRGPLWFGSTAMVGLRGGTPVFDLARDFWSRLMSLVASALLYHAVADRTDPTRPVETSAHFCRRAPSPKTSAQSRRQPAGLSGGGERQPNVRFVGDWSGFVARVAGVSWFSSAMNRFLGGLTPGLLLQHRGGGC
jgi:hypothetical protein